ncbi:MAG: LURP-one-related family protein [Clostridia bacterium]|nr:LURP-one-related family protein [Clostridia bacterium]
MELSIRNKWVSLGGSSVVQDTAGNDVFKVKGKVFSFTAKKTITDLNDNVKYVVRNKFWRLFTYRAFILDPEENVKAEIRRKIFSLHDRYFVTSDMGELEVIGNIFQFNYKILLNGQEIGHVARKISLRDSFVLTINDDVDAAFMVALVIAIDNITDRKDQNSRSSFSSSSN